MNLVEEFKRASHRIRAVENHLRNSNNPSENNKALNFMLEALGETNEQLEVELEGLKITEAWLKDIIAHYVEEKGFSIDKNFESIMGMDFETWKESDENINK